MSWAETARKKVILAQLAWLCGVQDVGSVRNFAPYRFQAFFNGGDLNPGQRHSRDTRYDGTVTLCTLCAATVLSRDCRADFGRPLTKKVMSHSRDGPGVTAPSRTNIVPLTGVWNPPPFRYPPPPPLKKSPVFVQII